MAEFQQYGTLGDTVPNFMSGMAAHDLRTAILSRLETYRELQAASARVQPLADAQVSSSHTAELELSQAALLRHIRLLSTLATQLEKKLGHRRWLRLVAIPLLALLDRIIYFSLYKLPYFRGWSPWHLKNDRGESRPALLDILAITPLFTWPLGIWNIYQYERKLYKTARLQENLIEMEYAVERGYPVQDSSRCLEDSRWNGIPWDDKGESKWPRWW